jgi:hypothetical protein
MFEDHKFYTHDADNSLAGSTSLSIVFQSREEVVVRRGQIQRIEGVITILEAQVGQFLLGCKCPVRPFFPGRAKDLSATCILIPICSALLYI